MSKLYTLSDPSFIWDISPQPGNMISVDTWRDLSPKPLLKDMSSWNKCQFRVKMGGGLYEVAVNVEISGRTIQTRSGYGMQKWVRVKITFPGDGEPDTECRGWMFVELDRVIPARVDAYHQLREKRQTERAAQILHRARVELEKRRVIAAALQEKQRLEKEQAARVKALGRFAFLEF